MKLLTPKEIVAIVKKHDGDLVQMWNMKVTRGTLGVDSCMNYVLKAQQELTNKEWIEWTRKNCRIKGTEAMAEWLDLLKEVEK